MNAYSHGVSPAEAQSYIDNSEIMFHQGNRNLYVSQDGSAVVLTENDRLITAYRKDEYDDAMKKIIGVIYG